MQGLQLGHYVLGSRLGSGGMGEVWQARDERLQRDVALKFLHASLGLDEEAEERLLREARAASALQHPGILTIHALERIEGRSFLVMECLKGNDIDAAARDLPDDGGETAIRWVIDAADALAAAHARGIVHRDIKPSNLFVETSGRVVVMDFGLAHVANAPALTRSGSTVGTLGYTAPEQLEGGEVTPAADVFALGAVLHELVTGRPAFNQERGLAALIRSVLEDEPPRLDGIAPAAADAVANALRKSASERIPNAAAFRDALQAALPEGPGAGPGHVSARAPRRFRHVGALALAACGLALFLWSISQRGASPTPPDVPSPEFHAGPGRLSGSEQPPTAPPPTFGSQQRLGLFVDRAEAPRLSPDATTIAYVADADAVPQVFVANLDDPSPRRITSFEHGARRPLWTPDGKQLLVEVPSAGVSHSLAGSSSPTALVLVPLLGGEPREVIQRGVNAAFDQSGNLLVFEHRGQAFLHDRQAGTTEALKAIPRDQTGSCRLFPTLSPSGTEVAYVRGRLGPLGTIEILDLETGRTRELMGERGRHLDLSFAPDGEALLFSSDIASAFNLWRVELASGRRTQITTGAGDDLAASAALDRLVYQNRRDDFELVVFDPASGEERVLHRSRGSVLGARFDPRGERVVFCAEGSGSAEVYVVDVAGGAPRRVTRGGDALRLFPCWIDEDSLLCYVDATDRVGIVRLDVATGDEEMWIPNWSMQDHPFAEPEPFGKRVAVFQVNPPATLIIDPATPDVPELVLQGFRARWAPSGKALVLQCFDGVLRIVDTSDGAPSTGAAVAAGERGGIDPFMSQAGDRVFWRMPGGGSSAQLRTVALDGLLPVGEPKNGPRLNGSLTSINSIDVASSGQVTFVRYVEGTSEVWVMSRSER